MATAICRRFSSLPSALSAKESGQRSRQVRLAHQEQIDAAGGAAAFGNRPDDQRLAALHVAGGEHAGHAGHPVGVAPDVAALGQLDAELSSSPLRSGPRKPIASSTRSASSSNSLPGTFSNDILPSLRTSSTFEPCSFLTRPCSSPLKRCVDDRVHAIAALFVRGRYAEDVRPERPRVVCRAGVRRLRQQLELVHGQCALRDAPCRGSRRRCRRRR